MRTNVIRSFLSLPFFKPPKAIFVPGMYFFGFSRYSNYTGMSVNRPADQCQGAVGTNQSVLFPFDALLLVCVGVREALDLAGLAAEKSVQVGPDLVPFTLLQVVALRAPCLSSTSAAKVAVSSADGSVAFSCTYLKETGTLLCVTCTALYQLQSSSLIMAS